MVDFALRNFRSVNAQQISIIVLQRGGAFLQPLAIAIQVVSLLPVTVQYNRLLLAQPQLARCLVTAGANSR